MPNPPIYKCYKLAYCFFFFSYYLQVLQVLPFICNLFNKKLEKLFTNSQMNTKNNHFMFVRD